MKTQSFSFPVLAQVVGLLAFLCALLVPAQAQTPIGATPTRVSTFDGLPSIVVGSATSNITSTAISVRQDKGLAVLPYFAGTNASTANVILGFQVSVDGSNWSTTQIYVTNAMTGTTAVRGFNLIPPSVLNNVPYVRLRSIQNAHTASVFVTNVTWSVGN